MCQFPLCQFPLCIPCIMYKYIGHAVIGAALSIAACVRPIQAAQASLAYALYNIVLLEKRNIRRHLGIKTQIYVSILSSFLGAYTFSTLLHEKMEVAYFPLYYMHLVFGTKCVMFIMYPTILASLEYGLYRCEMSPLSDTLGRVLRAVENATVAFVASQQEEHTTTTITDAQIEAAAPLRCATLHSTNQSTNIEPFDYFCSVCQETFEPHTLHRVLPCRHAFHAGCIDQWLCAHATCPLCKTSMNPHASNTAAPTGTADINSGANDDAGFNGEDEVILRAEEVIPRPEEPEEITSRTEEVVVENEGVDRAQNNSTIRSMEFTVALDPIRIITFLRNLTF